jgi:hypothetical protein
VAAEKDSSTKILLFTRTTTSSYILNSTALISFVFPIILSLRYSRRSLFIRTRRRRFFAKEASQR